jgi:predicted DNA binding CopG/RHH family protein
MPNHWIEQVKKYAKEKGMNYNQALNKAASTYKSS